MHALGALDGVSQSWPTRVADSATLLGPAAEISIRSRNRATPPSAVQRALPSAHTASRKDSHGSLPQRLRLKRCWIQILLWSSLLASLAITRLTHCSTSIHAALPGLSILVRRICFSHSFCSTSGSILRNIMSFCYEVHQDLCAHPLLTGYDGRDGEH